MTRDLRAPVITPSFPTSTRSTACGRSGAASFDRREETVRRDRPGLSGRRHARLPLSSDHVQRLTSRDSLFAAAGRQPIELGWRAAFPEWQPADEKGDEAQLLPALRNGETTKLENPTIEDKETRPPAAIQ